jgi:hypothetical protein
MGVLEKFLILFESDASDASKDVKKLDKSLDDTEKSATGATKAAGTTSKQFLTMGTKALGAVGGIVAITSAITGLISTAGRVDELGKFADLIGENIEDVDAWGGAVVRAGGTAEGFQGSIQSLNEKMVDASVKGFNEITPFFNQLGISIVDVNGKVKSTIDILPELAASFEGMDKQKSLGIGQKLGLDAGTIMLLQSGKASIDEVIERQKSLGVVNRESAIEAAKFNDIMADFKQISGFAAQGLMTSVVPAITWTIDKLINLSMWARENKPIIYGFFTGLAVVAIPSLISLAAAGWAAIAPLIVMAAPFIAIAAAAGLVGVAIGLVIEDIISFVNGQDSLIGGVLDKWPIIGEVVKFLSNDIKSFIGMMKDLGGFLLNLFIAPEKALQSLKDTLSTMKEFFDFDDVINKKIEGVKSFFGFGGEETELKKNIEVGQGSIDLATSSPLASQTSNSIQNNNRSSSKNTSVQTGDIIVQTQATDAQGIAAGVGGSLREEMRTTVENFDDGILI